MKNIIFHGPIRTQVGMKPLYKARKPSLRTVWMKQSTLPLYNNLEPIVVLGAAELGARRCFWFIRRVC